MGSSSDALIDALRGKTKVWLLDNDPEYFKDSSLFDEGKSPIMCDFEEKLELPTFEAYESGNRSILFKHNNKWCKAKGIGIPTGVSRPIYLNGKIFTHQLYNDPGMCHETILWGFMQGSEYECELYGSRKAEELGQNIEIIGSSIYENVYYLRLKDRIELFKKLKGMKKGDLIKNYEKESVKTKAYSAYYYVPSDIRVGELLFTFMFPEVTQLMDPALIVDYVKWLGSYSGGLLKEFHDSGNLHGTWVGPQYTSLGVLDIHSNSYTGNYIVDDERLTMCDFDLSKPIEDASMRDIEKWALINIENPLHYAGSFNQRDALYQGIAKKNRFREELAEIFENSVKSGYDGEPFEVERKTRKEMLQRVTKAKIMLWDHYGLPKSLTGQIDYIDYVISKKTPDADRLKENSLNF
jgi:hypothetical protein